MTLGMDPVLVNLLGNARSEAVRREFLSTPPEEYTQLHNVTVLVRAIDSQGRPMQGSSAFKDTILLSGRLRTLAQRDASDVQLDTAKAAHRHSSGGPACLQVGACIGPEWQATA